MEYLAIVKGDAVLVASAASRAAADGWRLMGPVVPVPHLGLPTTFIATMERSVERDEETEMVVRKAVAEVEAEVRKELGR